MPSAPATPTERGRPTSWRRAAIGVLLLFAGLYGLTFHGFVDIEDVEVCYQATRNLVEHGSLSIDDSKSGQRAIERGFYVAVGPGGRHYPIYPLAQIALPAPLYALGRAASGLARDKPDEVARLAFSSLGVLTGALGCVLVLLLGRQVGLRPGFAAITAVVAGSGTMLWVYAQSTFIDGPLATAFTASVLCTRIGLRDDRPGARAWSPAWIGSAGLLHGVTCALRPVGLVLLLPVLLALRPRGWRACATFVAATAAVVAAVVTADVFLAGRPLAASYLGYASGHAPRLTSSYTLALLGLLLSDGRGLFMLAPVLLLALPAWLELRERQPATTMLLLGPLVTLALFFAAFDGWHGAWCWGPRYLLPAVPPLAVLAGLGLQNGGRLRRAVAVALLLPSLWIQMLSVAVPSRIYMTAISSAGTDLTQFFYYPRYGPIRANWHILAKKLRGEPDVYTLRELFGLPDDRPLDVTRRPLPEISRYNAGFQHFAWLRVWQKGHRPAALAAVLGCLTAIATGLVLLWRAVRRPPQPAAPG